MQKKQSPGNLYPSLDFVFDPSLKLAIKMAAGLTAAVAGNFSLATGAALANGGAWALQSQPVQNHFGQAALMHAAPQAAQVSLAPLSHAQHAQHSSSNSFHQYNNVFLRPTSVVPQLNGTAATSLSGDLNLSSSRAAFLAGKLANFESLTLRIGNTVQTISLNSRLTAAEVVAAEQILSGGHQTLRLNTDGSASGGTIKLDDKLFAALDASVGGQINSLTVATGVKVVDSLSSLSLSGNLNNYGSILTAAQVAGSTDIIAAANIQNAAGGTISNYTGKNGGLFGAAIQLDATTSIDNAGMISSAKNLQLNTPLLNNAGTITAAGNLGITNNNAVNPSLTINNSTGTLAAKNGAINIASNNGDITAVGGGNYLSRTLNFDAGTANLALNAGTVSGVINASADCVHIMTASTQILGNINAAGDPQFVSTSGNLLITGAIAASGGADLAFIAANNVVSEKGAAISTANSAGGNGGNLVIIAGADVTGDEANATVNGGSAAGGIIDLNGGNGGSGPITSLTTAGTTSGNGGSIQFIAYAGTAKNSGSVIVPTKVAIDASGASAGSAGPVTIIAGGAVAKGITTGNITGGTITLNNATPLTSPSITFKNGTLTSGNIFSGSIVKGGLSTGILTGDSVNIETGANLGTASKAVDIEASSLSYQGNVPKTSAYFVSHASTPVAINQAQSSSDGTFQLTAAGGIAVQTQITATTINLIATGSGGITSTSSINALTVNLTADTGAINAKVASSLVNVKSNGAVTITGTGLPLSIGTVSGAITAFSLTNAGDITVTKPLNAGTIALNAGTTGDILLNSTLGSTKGLTPTTTISLTADNVSGKGALTATQQLSISASGNIGTSTAPLNTVAANMQLDGQSVWISQKGDTRVSGSSQSALFDSTKTFSIKSTGNLTLGDINSYQASYVTSKSLVVDGKVRGTDGVSDVNTAIATIKGDFTISSTGDYSGGISSTTSFPQILKVPGNAIINGTFNADFFNLQATGNITVGNSGSISGGPSLTGKTFVNSGNVGGFLVSITATGTGLAALDNKGTIDSSAGFITLNTTNAAAGITNENAIKTGSLNLNTNNVINNGTITLDTQSSTNHTRLQIIGTSSLTVSGNGTINSTPFGALSLASLKNVTISGTAASNPFSSLTQLSEFDIGAEQGVFTTPVSAINVFSDTTGKGGVINMTVGSIVYGSSATMPLTLTADGSMSTSGSSQQKIELFLPGTATSGVTIGNQPGNLDIVATGKSNGSITVSTPGILTVNSQFLTTNGTASLNAKSPLVLNGVKGIVLNGNLSTLNGDGSYGDIQIITSAKTPFMITNSQSIQGGLLTFITPGGVSIGVDSSISASEAIFTTGSSFTVQTSASLSTPSVVFGLGAGNYTYTNDGTVTSPLTAFTLSALTGSLTVNGPVPTGLVALTIQAGSGNLTFAGTQNLSADAIVIGATGGNIAFANGNNTINVSTFANGNGGNLAINAATVSGSAVAISANSTPTHNGASVDIELTGTKTLTLGANAFSIAMDNQSASTSPILTLKNGGPLSIDSAALNITGSGDGADVILSSTKGPLYVSSIDSLQNSNLANLTVTSGSSTTFVMGGAKFGTNGFGDTTTATLVPTSSLTISNGGSIDASKAVLAAHKISLVSAKGALILASNQAVTAAADASGNGGEIDITAASLTGSAAILRAQGNKTGGAGGTVDLNVTGSKPLAIGGATGVIIDVTNGPTGPGGTINVANGGNISADAVALTIGSNFGSNTGPSINLNAKGLLYVSDAGAISNPQIASIALTSNSPTTFVLHDATAKGNGLNYSGGGQLSAGNISITNNKGAIDLSDIGTDLDAPNLTLSAPASSLIFANAATINQQSTTSNASLNLTAKTIANLPSLQFVVNSMTGAAEFSLTLTGTQALTINQTSGPKAITQAPGAATITINNGGNVLVAADNNLATLSSGNLNNLAVSAKGLLNVDNSQSFLALFDSVSLSSNSKTPFLISGATATGNGITGTNALTNNNIMIANLGGAIALNNNGVGAQSISAANSLTLNAAQDIGSAAQAITILSSPSVNVITGAAGSAYLIGTGSIGVTSANVGKTLTVDFASGNLTFGGTGNQKVSAGSINLAVIGDPNNTDTVTLGNIASTNGDVLVASSAQHLAVAPAALISSNNGNIYLNNSDNSTTNQPDITFGNGSTVHGVGPTSNSHQGNVYIYLGSAPNAANPSNPLPYFILTGQKPTNGTFTGFNLQWSGLDNPAGNNGTITTADKTDTFNSINGRLVAFNTGTYAASQISLAPNVTITADPPVAKVNPLLAQLSPTAVASIAPQTNIASSQLVPSSIHAPAQAIGILAQQTTIQTYQTNNNYLNYGPVQTVSRANNADAIIGPDFASKRSIDDDTTNAPSPRLARGATLYAPEKNTQIDTAAGQLHIRAGSIVLVINDDDKLAIYNLHDSTRGAVMLKGPTHSVVLTPGRLLVASQTNKTTAAFANINPARFVGYRNINSRAAGTFEGEFEIVSMLKGLNLTDGKTLSKVVKTAAILSGLRQGGAAFTYHLPPEITASLPPAMR